MAATPRSRPTAPIACRRKTARARGRARSIDRAAASSSRDARRTDKTPWRARTRCTRGPASTPSSWAYSEARRHGDGRRAVPMPGWDGCEAGRMGGAAEGSSTRRTRIVRSTGRRKPMRRHPGHPITGRDAVAVAQRAAVEPPSPTVPGGGAWNSARRRAPRKATAAAIRRRRQNGAGGGDGGDGDDGRAGDGDGDDAGGGASGGGAGGDGRRQRRRRRVGAGEARAVVERRRRWRRRWPRSRLSGCHQSYGRSRATRASQSSAMQSAMITAVMTTPRPPPCLQQSPSPPRPRAPALCSVTSRSCVRTLAKAARACAHVEFGGWHSR